MPDWLDTGLRVITPLGMFAVVAISVYINWRRPRDASLKDQGEWKGGVDADIKNIKEFMKEIREDVKEIFDRLPPRAVTTESPLRLTDLGERIAVHLQARSWAGSLAPTLSDEVGGKQPFQIDEFANAYVHEMLDDDWNVKVASCAYEFGIDKDGVLSVLRIVLRDALLQTQKSTMDT